MKSGKYDNTPSFGPGDVRHQETFVPVEIEDGLILRYLPVDRWKTASLSVAFRVPMQREVVTKLGLVPRLSSRGTKSLPNMTEMARYLDDHYGARMRANAIKVGYCQVISFSVGFPNPAILGTAPEGTALVKDLLGFIWACAVEPRLEQEGYPADVFEHEKQEQRRDIEAIVNSRPEYAMVRLMEILSQGDPSGLPAWGTLSDLDKIGPADTWAAWKEATASCAADVYSVGVEGETLKRVCQEHDFAFPHSRNYRPHLQVKRDPPSIPEETIVVEDRLPGSQTILCVALATGVGAADPRYPALLMYNGVLGGFPHSKLFTEVRERAGMAYFADTVVNSWRGMVIATAGIPDERRSQVEGLILEQVRRISSGDVSHDEIEKTRKGLMRRLMSERDSPASLIRRSLDSTILGGPATDEELGRMILEVKREDVIALGEKVRPVAVYALRAMKPDDVGRDIS